MTLAERHRVSADLLRWTCDPSTFTFTDTQDLVPLGEYVGQDRAISSLEFGLAIDRPGYNIFVTGLTGTGKATAIKAYVERAAENRKRQESGFAADDWCYVQIAADPDRSEAIRLPKGKGSVLRDQMLALLSDIKAAISRALGSDEYQQQRKAIIDQGQAQHQQMMQALDRLAQEASFFVEVSPMGVSLVPVIQGQPVTPQQFMGLPDEQRRDIDQKRATIMEQVQETFLRTRALEKETRERLGTLEQRAAELSVAQLFQELLNDYAEQPDAVRYIESLHDFTLKNVALFQQQEQPAEPTAPFLAPGRNLVDRDPLLAFQVNVFVDNTAVDGPPIIIEPNPTWANLFGKIERRAVMGTYISDHTMLKPGAMHLANSGYLILNVRDLLLNPGVWEGLKRVIRTKEVRLDEPYEQMGFLAPQGLRPEPIPVQAKIIVSGDDLLYQMLAQYDEDFWELFKVKADFDYEIDRSARNLDAYAAFISGCCGQDGLLAFETTAVAKVIEYGARLVGHQEKLSSRFGKLRDLLIEADYWARRNGDSRITAHHVRNALEQRLYRSNLIEERIQELIKEGTLMVDLEGDVVGQVNGLSVLMLADFSFGKPSRITAETFIGRRGVINIEREAQLSGRTHDKGVLILSGYLGQKYAQDKPLSLSASLCFEQSYEGVDGDSASSTELYAILSNLSGMPINQGIAVTGSINQKGEIQPIGGVNEKIEGFYAVCKAKGLIGDQGVIIPRSNLRHLMLKEEVVEAVSQGQFHIYAISTVDQGMEILTGIPIGERGENGEYPEGSLNYRVDKRLKEFAEGLKGYSGRDD